MRYRCIISYDGTNFHGFQRQNNLRTVQGEVEKAIELAFHEITKIVASGRTDAHVHALEQTIHFDLKLKIEGNSLKKALNSYLPLDIHLIEAIVTDESFHARYSAHLKEYRYLIDFKEYNPLYANYRFFYPYHNLNIDKMVEASEIFIGEHDFKSFSKENTVQKKVFTEGNKGETITNTVRIITKFSLNYADGLLEIAVVGNGFLHNQVRIMIGMLLEVGKGKLTKEDLWKIMNKKDRRYAPKVISPNGLYLYKVYY